MNKILLVVLAVFSIGAMFSCQKETLKKMAADQEKNIESFIEARLQQVDTAYVVRNNGVNRVVIVPGQGDSLNASGTVSFYYALYKLTGASVSSSSLLYTNSKTSASSAGWNVTDSTAFEIKTLGLNEDGLVDGLKYGLEGVRAGQECFVVFSGQKGFGKKASGTIPANAALVYQIWVESISNE